MEQPSETVTTKKEGEEDVNVTLLESQTNTSGDNPTTIETQNTQENESLERATLTLEDLPHLPDPTLSSPESPENVAIASNDIPNSLEQESSPNNTPETKTIMEHQLPQTPELILSPESPKPFDLSPSDIPNTPETKLQLAEQIPKIPQPSLSPESPEPLQLSLEDVNISNTEETPKSQEIKLPTGNELSESPESIDITPNDIPKSPIEEESYGEESPEKEPLKEIVFEDIEIPLIRKVPLVPKPTLSPISPISPIPVKESPSDIPSSNEPSPKSESESNTPIVTSIATPETTPIATPETTPETTPDTTLEITPIVTPETTPTTTPIDITATTELQIKQTEAPTIQPILQAETVTEPVTEPVLQPPPTESPKLQPEKTEELPKPQVQIPVHVQDQPPAKKVVEKPIAPKSRPPLVQIKKAQIATTPDFPVKVIEPATKLINTLDVRRKLDLTDESVPEKKQSSPPIKNEPKQSIPFPQKQAKQATPPNPPQKQPTPPQKQPTPPQKNPSPPGGGGGPPGGGPPVIPAAKRVVVAPRRYHDLEDYKGPLDEYDINQLGDEFKKTPLSIANIIDPTYRLTVPYKTSPNVGKEVATLASLEGLIQHIKDIINSPSASVIKLNLDKYILALPQPPSINSPYLIKNATTRGVKDMNVNPLYIVQLILDHMKNIAYFREFNTGLIPSTIKQDLLETNKLYSYNKDLYLADYTNIESTLKKLSQWSRDMTERGWNQLFSNYLQENMTSIPDIVEKSFTYLSILLVFYYYMGITFSGLNQNDLFSYWETFDIKARQGAQIVKNITNESERYVYKYEPIHNILTSVNDEEESLQRRGKQSKTTIGAPKQTGAPNQPGAPNNVIPPQNVTPQIVVPQPPRYSPVIPVETKTPPYTPKQASPPVPKTVTITEPKLSTAPVKAVKQIPAVIDISKLTQGSKSYDDNEIAYTYVICMLISEFKKIIIRIVVAQETKRQMDFTAECNEWITRTASTLQFIDNNFQLTRNSKFTSIIQDLQRAYDYFHK